MRLMFRSLLPLLLLAASSGCRDQEVRQPTAAELANYTGQVDRAEAAARSEAVRSSRAKEAAVEREHSDRLRAQD